jgi:hypothetical protein
MTPEQYARSGHKKVRGWLNTSDAMAITRLARTQTIGGGACEIGVHHGRLFTLLHLLTQGPSVAVDLFDSQEQNTDRSGYGSRETLLRNVARFGDPTRVRVIAGNSLQVTPDQILRAAEGPVRLFSVDGGHTAECTYNDLSLALVSTREGSLVILDDYFNRHWPAVSEGATQFMRERPGLSPVLIVGNKFIFAHGDGEPFRAKAEGDRSHVFGQDVVVGSARPLRSLVARSTIWRKIRRLRPTA